MLFSPSIKVLLAAALFLAAGCTPKEQAAPEAPQPPLFARLPPAQTHVDFNNALSEAPGVNRNILMYEYFANGGGVAAGDLNGDGLEDLYFSANMGYNKLYLNQGDLTFREVASEAGTGGRKNTWKTGVSMADVNGDGRLDLYVAYSGQLPLERRVDELYINQGPDSSGVPQFEEQAAAYGLAQPHSSTQGYFFDYDRDGDLDLFLLTHNVRSLPRTGAEVTQQLLKERDSVNGLQFYRNDDGRFTEVTEEAGLQGSPLIYGLGAGVADVNEDGWLDVYIANDYAPPDYLYLNNGDGTFTDALQDAMGHTSRASMGVDVADMNNDGLSDLVVLDMLPEGNFRQKMLFVPNDRDQQARDVASGFHYQYMRNTLQLNNGTPGAIPGQAPTFSEIGQLAGLSNTDWSWAPLAADYDNDGWNDLFVTNGILRDFTNRDFIRFKQRYIRERDSSLGRQDIARLLSRLPATTLTNYLFQNNGDLTFGDVTAQWGVDRPSNSNGAAYADLDNDGDLDLVTNNINEPAFLFENRAEDQLDHHYVQVKLEGTGKNTFGVGASLTVYADGLAQRREQMPTRGYLSSVSPVLHVGLGAHTRVDSLRVVWPDGTQQTLVDLAADQRLTLRQENASAADPSPTPSPPLFAERPAPIDFQHRLGGVTDDFKRQPLMANPASFSGPALEKADINGDGLDDVFAGGGPGQASKLYLQQPGGAFVTDSQPAFEADARSDDVEALFFDANGDGAPDLYVASGGYGYFGPADPALQDRLYVNDGQGRFARSEAALPPMLTSTGAVAATDIDGDGALDLFAGGRVIPGRYPAPPRSYVLLNDGQGHFADQTAEIAPALQRTGMVSDAAWHDLDGDGTDELVVAGVWMPIRVFGNAGGALSDQTDAYFEKPYRGLWNELLIDDLNGDGAPDLLAGNFGLNSQLQASAEEPAALYYADFDDNGTVDPILSFYVEGTRYPHPTLDELTDQMFMMQSRFASYAQYAEATAEDLFTEEELEKAGTLEANFLETALFVGGKDGALRKAALPVEAQFAPVFALATLDYNGDGHRDLFLGGNINEARIRLGKYDANYGMLLEGDGAGGFRYLPQHESGFELRGDVRNVLEINRTLLFGINRAPVRAYRPTKPSSEPAQLTETLPEE